MQLDECVALPAEREEMERAMELSLRWARALARRRSARSRSAALFGIQQGGDDRGAARAIGRSG